MTKLTIESEELASLLKDYKESDRRNMQYTARNLFAYMAERLAAAYEQGKKDKLPTIEWNDLPEPDVPLAALYDFIPNWCQGDPTKIALASAAFYACAKAVQGAPLPKEPTE